jgi:hypothetical protein
MNLPTLPLTQSFPPPPCAWCLDEQGTLATTSGSHGICSFHFEKVLRDFRAHRRARAAARAAIQQQSHVELS